MLGERAGERGLRGALAQTSPVHSIPLAVPEGVATGMSWAMFQDHGPGFRGV